MEYKNIVNKIIINQLKYKIKGIENITFKDDFNFKNHLGADSLDVMEIIMTCENAFRIKISDDIAGNIKTYGELCQELQSKISEKNG